jgi:hypothetical protein
VGREEEEGLWWWWRCGHGWNGETGGGVECVRREKSELRDLAQDKRVV